MPFFKKDKKEKRNSIFPSLVFAELNSLCSIVQVMHASLSTLS